jgi:hypothetical protein
MRPLLVWMAAAGALTGGSAHGAAVEVRDAVARVTVIPEARNDVKVEVVRANPRLPITVRTALGGEVVVDGRLDHRIRGCRKVDGRPSVTVTGLGEVGWDEMPEIIIHTPRAVDIAAGGAVFGSVGRSDKLTLSSAGCGDWMAGNVAGALRLSQAGSGDARIGRAAAAHVRIAGSGDVSVAHVAGPVQVEIAGSGDVEVAGVSGALTVNVAGSGDVSVASGRASAMNVSIAGSGDVDFGGVADSLKAQVTGSGDVRARRVTGQVEKRVIGHGMVKIG